MYDYSEVSDACIKCGKCKPVCTIFDISHDESTSPRGFIDLLGAYQNNDLVLNKNTKDIFESCFLCTNCVDVCPIDLPVDTIIENVRFEIAKEFGITWYKRLFFFLLRHRSIMDFMAKMGYVFQSCAIKIKEQAGYATIRSFPMSKKTRALPFAKSNSFLNTYDENIPAKNQDVKNKKVAIFIGCMVNYAYLDTGYSLVEILKKANIDIIIPKKQLCCGAPAYFTGDFNTVDYLTKKNIDYFEGFIDEIDAILIPEATCSAMMKEDWERFFKDNKDYQKRAKKLSEKMFMATDWIYKNTNINKLLENKHKINGKTVTYHDACHARKVQGVYKEPRTLLANNYEMQEMSNSNVCCGFGGITMQSEKYHLAKKSGKTKADMIIKTKADIVSAECSACRMQITNSLYQEDSNIKFEHPLKLINDALRGKNE